MIRTVEAIINEQGAVLLQEAVALTGSHRALVTVLEDEPYSNGTALLSEADTAADPLVTRPQRPREGWEEHFKQMAADGEDKLLDAEFLTPTQWDKEEWEW